MKRRIKRFADFMLALDISATLAVVVLVISLFTLIYSYFSDQYIQMHRQEAERVQLLLEHGLQQTQYDLEFYAGLPDSVRDGVQSYYLRSFSDLYRLDSNQAIEKIYISSPNSRLFVGFSFAEGNIGHYIGSAVRGTFSDITSGAEDDLPGIYYYFHSGNQNFLARIELSSLNSLLKKSAEVSGKPVLLLSGDGFVISSTNPELNIISMSPFIKNRSQTLTVDGTQWRVLLSRSTKSGVIIALLIPLHVTELLRNILILTAGVCILLLILISLIRKKFTDRQMVVPLSLFKQKMEHFTGEKGIPISDVGAYPFEELQILDLRFTEMVSAIAEREAGLQRALSELQASRNFTVQAVDSSHELFGWLSLDGALHFANATSLKMIGASLDDVVGKLIWDTPWFNHDSVEQEKIKGAIAGAAKGNQVRFEATHKTDRGEVREIDIHVSPTFAVTGEISMLVVEGIDITNEKAHIHQKEKLTEQLHQSQKMESIGQLAGGVAHDFNNALGGIIGASELVLGSGNLTDLQRKYLNMILTAAERAGSLTKKLLVFSRRGTKASSPVDCAAITEDTAALLRQTVDKAITISFENRAQQTMVIGDDSQLQNALMNIGINASHAMPSGGELRYTLENLDLDEAYCQASPFVLKPGQYLEIAVRDTGCGMSPEIASRIFEPFFTTKEQGKGTGLGLAMVYGAIQEHGGAIAVYSEVGNGTVFHLYLPLSGEAVGHKTKAPLSVQGTGTILIIDDEELIRITASSMLHSVGYQIILASNGQKGVEAFREKKNEIDLIILDMIMPVMGGREAFGKLREIDPKIPIVIASGFAKEEAMAELKKQGVNGFLNKPFRKAELAEIVRNTVKKTHP